LSPTRIEGETFNSESIELAQGLIEQTNLYKKSMAIKDEIMKHKWLESEKVGYDVGFNLAMIDWVCKHKAAWEKQHKASALLEDKPASYTS
jgi:hypothetical protein